MNISHIILHVIASNLKFFLDSTTGSPSTSSSDSPSTSTQSSSSASPSTPNDDDDDDDNDGDTGAASLHLPSFFLVMCVLISSLEFFRVQ